MKSLLAELNMRYFNSANRLLYNGVQLTTVQKLLGHQSIRTTEVYSDIMDMTIIRDLEDAKKKKKNRNKMQTTD